LYCLIFRNVFAAQRSHWFFETLLFPNLNLCEIEDFIMWLTYPSFWAVNSKQTIYVYKVRQFIQNINYMINLSTVHDASAYNFIFHLPNTPFRFADTGWLFLNPTRKLCSHNILRKKRYGQSEIDYLTRQHFGWIQHWMISKLLSDIQQPIEENECSIDFIFSQYLWNLICDFHLAHNL